MVLIALVVGAVLLSRRFSKSMSHVLCGPEVLTRWLNIPRASERQRRRQCRAVRKRLDCASEAGLFTIDLSEPLKPAVKVSGVGALFRSDHHTAKGNRLVAGLIMQALVRLSSLPYGTILPARPKRGRRGGR